MDNGAVNVVKSFVGDPAGDYRYLGEIKKGMHIVSYMFTDDASTDDGVFLAVGTVQYYVVSGVECRLANEEESNDCNCDIFLSEFTSKDRDQYVRDSTDSNTV